MLSNKGLGISTSFGYKSKEQEVSDCDFNLTQVTGPKASGALSKKSKRPKSKKPPTETKVSPPKPTKGSKQSHSVPSGTVPDPQDLKRNIQLASTRLPSTLNEGTHKSQPLLKSMAKTMSRPKGSRGDKDSGGNKPPADIEPLNLTDVDLSRTGAKYQEDQTQSSRLTYQSLTRNEGKPSYEGETDTQPMILSYADVRAILLYEDEVQESEKDGLGAGEEMDDNLKSDKIHHQSSLPHTEASDTDSSTDKILKKITEDQWKKHEEVFVHYVNLKASIDDYYNENIAHIDQTGQLVEASMSSLEKSSTTINDHYKGLEVITQLLKENKHSVKDDHATNKKIEKASETFTKLSKQTTEILSSVKNFNFSTLLSTVKNIQDHAFKQKEASAAWMKSFTNMAWNLEDQGKLVKESSIVRPDPDEPVRVEFVINGKTVYLTKQEIQAYWDKEEEIKKAKKEDRLNAISKPEVIKVVCKKAKKLGIHLKEAISTEAGELFKKAQDTEHEVLKRQHTEKSDIDKVGMEALVSYLVAASMVKSHENARFSMKLRKFIAEHPDQEKLKSNKVKLEALEHNMDRVLM
nr:hypothetical protein [Tanacetum cinerariifolium]